MMKKGLLLGLLVLFVLSATPALAAHTSNGTLVPEWSPAGELVNYNVTICNEPDGGDPNDPIDEVRIIKNPLYTTFSCEEKPNWTRIFVSPWYEPGVGGMTEMCWYFTLNETYNIEEGGCEDFFFSATTPDLENCDLPWKFETRDQESETQGDWQAIFVSTGIDDTPPELVKTLTSPYDERDGSCPPAPNSTEECWVANHETTISVMVTDPGDDKCQGEDVPPSGMDFCTFRINLDGEFLKEWTVYNDEDGDESDDPNQIIHSFVFEEDSLHELTITCYDVAGNEIEETELFRVDSTPPETSKEFIGPQKLEETQDGVIEWIDGVTTVELNAEDPDPTGEGCNIGVALTWYSNRLFEGEGELACWQPARFCNEEFVGLSSPYESESYDGCIDEQVSACSEAATPGTDDWYDCIELYAVDNCGIDASWKLYRGEPVPKDEESCHVLAYSSIDWLGNQEAMNYNCFFVDKTPPVINKTHPEGAIEDYDENLLETDGIFHWLTPEMPITLACEDPEPHPSGDEELCLRVSYDLADDGYLTEEYCDELGGKLNESEEPAWCCFDMSCDAELTIAFNNTADGDSLHDLEYYCHDAVNKTSEKEIQYYRVDSTPPVITKEMFGSWLGDCPPGSESDVCYVADNGESGVIVNVTDPDPSVQGCNVNNISCEYEIWWDATSEECEGAGGTYESDWCLVDSGSFGEEGATIIFTEDSTHELLIWCEDSLGNLVEDEETFLVDSTPPTTEKVIGDPFLEGSYPKGCEDDCLIDGDGLGVDHSCFFECGWAEWLSTETPITLNASDEKSGVKKTYWRNLLVTDEMAGELICGNALLLDGLGEAGAEGLSAEMITHAPVACDPEFYRDYVDNSTPWKEYNGTPIYKEEESCHVLEYYSVDELGNTEELRWNCFFVDDTEPTMNKTIGEPKVEGRVIPGGECNETVTNETVVEKLDVLFLFDLTGSMGGVLGSAKSEAISLMSDISSLVPDSAFGVASFMDADGSQESCGYSGTYGDAASGDYQWSLDEDVTPDTSAVSGAINSLSLGFGADGPEGYAFALQQATTASWRPGAKRVVVIFQDNVPHDCTLGSFSGCSATTGADAGADGVAGTGDDPTWSGVASLLASEGISVISVDSGSADACRESVWGFMAEETGGIAASLGDNFTETIVELIGEVIVPCRENRSVTYVTGETPITLRCTDKDGQPHPADHVSLWYRYRFSDDCESWGEWSDWLDPSSPDMDGDPYVVEKVITFSEDSCHELEYYCEDGLGNALPVESEIDIVDTQPPVTTKTYTGPTWEVSCEDDDYLGDVSVDDDECVIRYVDNATRILLNATDPEPHPVGVKETYYRVSLFESDEPCYEPAECESEHDPDDEGWSLYDGPFGISEESCHLIEYYSVDELGNTEPVRAQCIFADHTPPVIEKEYEGPYYAEDGENCTVEYISNETLVRVGVEDPEPHPSGVASVEYRVSLVDDEACYHQDTLCQEAEGSGDWLGAGVEFNFSIPEESCHLIEVRAADNVNKSSLHKQCVFVDTSEPFPNKTVGEPRGPMSLENQELGAAFFPELDPAGENACEEEGACWEVSLLTPVTLGCEDPQPHPSGADEVCFNVNFDGSDVTDNYCERARGEMGEDGYCCVEELRRFHFKKQSWHKLSYYCVDNVENKGNASVDTEYFKVEETKFRVRLNKKWNLISVPVRLLDDSMDEVFAGHDSVVSVWHYDGASWHVYTPDGNPANDDLTTMEPGSGYWVFNVAPATLRLSGSLLSPGVTPPSTPIVHGWNLLGYYGTEGLSAYQGPAGKGRSASCLLSSIGGSVWDKGFTTVFGYWEPFNPDPWLRYGRWDRLDPGAGYWVFATEPGIHTIPPEGCGVLGP